MTYEDASRIVRGFLASVLVDGTFEDAVYSAGVDPGRARDLLAEARTVALELRSSAGVCSGNLEGVVTEVLGGRAT